MQIQIDFEMMAKAFIDLVKERYPSSDRVIKIAASLTSRLNIETPLKQVLAKIFILSRFRDAVRKVDPVNIFETMQHRDEIYDAILNALEDLEADLEELEEEIDIDFENTDFLDTEEEMIVNKEEEKGFWDISSDVQLDDDWWKEEEKEDESATKD